MSAEGSLELSASRPREETSPEPPSLDELSPRGEPSALRAEDLSPDVQPSEELSTVPHSSSESPERSHAQSDEGDIPFETLLGEIQGWPGVPSSPSP